MNPEVTAAPAKAKLGLLDPKANLRVIVQTAVLLVVLLGGLWRFLNFKAGSKAANATLSALTRQPIELKNSVECGPPPQGLGSA